MTTNLAVLLSGGGRTLQNFIDEIAAGRIEFPLAIELDERIAEIVLLVRAWNQAPGFRIAIV